MTEKICRLALPSSVVWDTVVRGLHLRVSKNNKKSFYIFYRTRSGIQRRPKIGEWGSDATLTEARRRARILLAHVALGGDPKGEWDKKKASKRLCDVFASVWEKHWSKEQYQRSGWAHEVWRNWQNHLLPFFGQQKINTITPIQIRQWLERYTSRPYAGNRSLEVLSKLFSYAEQQGWVEQGKNPTALVTPHPESKRKRYATPDELGRIGKLLDGEKVKHPGEVAMIYLLALTGSRPRALERAKWSDLSTFIDKESKNMYGVLSFHGKSSSATGEAETVVLPPVAMAVLTHYRDKAEGGYDLLGPIFPQSHRSYRRVWNRVREKAECKDLWIRDLRRTFATVGMSSGVGVGVMGELLNHHSAQTTKLYAKLMDGARMKAAQLTSEEMVTLLFKNK